MRKKKVIFVVLILVILLGGGFMYIILSKEDDTEGEFNTNTVETAEETYEMENESEDRQIQNEEYFTCDVDGEQIDYTQHINVDTPVENDTRISGLATNGSNIKLTLRISTPGEYSKSGDFSFSYQPKMEEYDYKEVYSTLMDSPKELELIEFSEEKITAKFSGEVYNSNSDVTRLDNCEVSIKR